MSEPTLTPGLREFIEFLDRSEALGRRVETIERRLDAVVAAVTAGHVNATANGAGVRPSESMKLVGVRELAAMHGPPASWWYANAEAGKVPSYKIGKYIRFKPSEIEAWLQTRRQGPETT